MLDFFERELDQLDPAVAVELTMREREALMTPADWERGVDRVLALPPDFPLGWPR